MADIKKIINNVKTVSDSEEEHKDGLGKKRAAFSATVIGLIAGLMVGYSQGWNLFYSAVGGGILGGVAAGIIAPND